MRTCALSISIILASFPTLVHGDVVIGFEADTTLINFGIYSESGFTFTQSSFQVNIEDAGPGMDGTLAFRTFTNGSPGAVMTNDGGSLFDLVSLNVDDFGIVAAFTVQASSGASHNLTGLGLVDFRTLPGDWTNLSSVTFQYSGAASSEHVVIDNVHLAFNSGIPEPASHGIAGCLLLGWIGCRRTRMRWK